MIMALPQNIIDVDVAKNRSDALCLATAKAERIYTIKQSLAQVAKGGKGCLGVLEASGGDERPPTEALTRFKADFCLVNPRHAREYARATGKLAKTDRVDAEMLARMGRALELQPTPPTPSERVELTERVELAERVARRDDLVAMIGAGRNRLGQSHNDWIRTQITSHIKGMVRHRKAVEAEIAKLTAADETLAAGRLCLQSMPGIGPAIAAVIQARLPELCQLDRRKLAGLAPRATGSGKRRIWGGRADLTRALYLAGFAASRCDPTLRAYRRKLQAAGKPTKVAIIACARKRRTILAAMMRDQTDYGDKKPA